MQCGHKVRHKLCSFLFKSKNNTICHKALVSGNIGRAAPSVLDFICKDISICDTDVPEQKLKASHVRVFITSFIEC